MHVGCAYCVEFLDHSEGDRPVLVEAYGRLMSKHKLYIVLRAWHAKGRDVSDSSQHQWAILRSTFERVYKLRGGP